MNEFRQHGVTIGGKRYVTDERGKFLPLPPEPAHTDTPEHENGNNTPQEDK